MEIDMFARIVWNPFGALVLGVLCLAVGGAALTGFNVACQDTTAALTSGQSCTGRTGQTLSFADWHSQERLITTALLALGGVLVVGGIFFLARRRRQRRAAAAAVAPRRDRMDGTVSDSGR
jgi:LPXTG-motif cell wall-anchored protein